MMRTLWLALALCCGPAAGDRCNSRVKVNWIHLQEDSDAWDGIFPSIAREWNIVASRVKSNFPDSKFGVARFGVRREQFSIISTLTRDLTLDLVTKSLGRAVGKGAQWPTREEGLKEADYKDALVKPTASLGPVVWTTLHSAWDQGESTYKFISVAQTTPTHFADDGSAEAVKRKALRLFGEDTYPVSAQELWPVNEQPHINLASNFPGLDLVKRLLASHNIHLMVLYGADSHTTPGASWRQVLSKLNVDEHKYLHFLPSSITTETDHTMSDFILSGMENALNCSIAAPLRSLHVAVPENGGDCDNVCVCHSADCRPCCKRGEDVVIDIVDQPPRLNLSMDN